MSKRPWESGASSDFKRRKTGDNHDPQPSKVVHVRNVADGTREHDLTSAVNSFGKVSYVTLMPKNRQALIEFESVESAVSLVNYTKNTEITVNSRVAFFNYSVSQSIKRAGNIGSSAYHEYGPNKVLLLTVLNPMYPITVDVLHTICQRHGQVQRIAIFHKNGVQALVEFLSADQATQAKQSLDGADIYAGCCTLKIEFSKADQVNVFVNNEESYDYTGTLQAHPPGQAMQAAGHMAHGAAQGYAQGGAYGQQAAYGGQAAGYGGVPVAGGYTAPTQAGAMQQPFGAGAAGGYDAYGQQQQQQQHQQQQYGAGQFGQQQQPQQPPPGGIYHGPPPTNSDPGAVVMVHNLDPERINCEKLFNMFCAYGNVLRVKIFVKKVGSALVQMDRREGASNAIKFLNEVPFMGQKLSLNFSRHSQIEDRGMVGKLPDGTAAVMEFQNSRNNRFQTPEQSRKNLMISPTKTLHYFNAPPEVSFDDLRSMFVNCSAPAPIFGLAFPRKSETSKQSGLMEWDSETEALEAMSICNHFTLSPSAGQAFTLKLAFSLSNPRKEGQAAAAGDAAMGQQDLKPEDQ